MSDTLRIAKEALRRPGAMLVIDIDGTLADDVARRHLRPLADPHSIGHLPLEQIERYMAPELVARDCPINLAGAFLSSLLDGASPPSRTAVVVTARWEALRGTTTRWLHRHYPMLRPSSLLMRSSGDGRPSVDVKLELAAQRGAGGVWLDDDPEMLAAAERGGFVALKAPDIYSRALYQPRRDRAHDAPRSGRRRTHVLEPTAPPRIPRGAVLCLCGAENECSLCVEDVQ